MFSPVFSGNFQVSEDSMKDRTWGKYKKKSPLDAKIKVEKDELKVFKDVHPYFVDILRSKYDFLYILGKDSDKDSIRISDSKTGITLTFKERTASNSFFRTWQSRKEFLNDSIRPWIKGGEYETSSPYDFKLR